MPNKRWLFLLFFLLSPPLEAQWRGIEAGFEYRRLENSQVHFFKIDSKKFRSDLLMAKDYGSTALTAGAFRQKAQALLVINGGFFDEAFHSLGLIFRRGQILNPLRQVAWGVFSLGEAGPSIVEKKMWKPDKVTMALQVGPRLVIGGQIPSFKESSLARRSGIGITPEGKLVIALSENAMTLREWAEILQKECPQALNLDGGGSTQISVSLPHFSLQISGATAVPNALGIFRP